MATDNVREGDLVTVEQVEQNGHTPKVIKTRYFTSSTGAKLRLRAVSPIVINQMQNDQTDKPEIPMVKTTIGPSKSTQLEPNPDDPEYKAALEAWQGRKHSRFLRYVFTQGVETDPDKESRARLKEFFPSASNTEIKYNWVAEHLVDDDEIAELAELIISINMSTKEGVREAEARFPGEG